MNTTIIIIVIYAIIHIASYIAKESAKRKLNQRAREAAQQKQRAAGAQVQVPSSVPPATDGTVFGQGGSYNPTPTPLPTQTVPRTGKPLDDLAARRKEQLEQLRNRREGRRIPQPAPLRVGTPRAVLPNVLAPTTVRDLPASDQSRSRQQDREQREREQAKAKRIQLAKAAQQRDAEAKKRRDMARRAAQMEEQRQQQLAEAPEGRPQAAAAITPRIPVKVADSKVGLRAKLMNQASLRELFVIKELLEPPIALRGPRA